MSRPRTQCLPKGQLPEATPVEGGRSGYGQKTQQSQRAKNREARMRRWTQAPARPGADALRFPSPPQAGRQPQPAAFVTPRHPPKHGFSNRPTPREATTRTPKKATGPGKGKQTATPFPSRGCRPAGSGLERDQTGKQQRKAKRRTGARAHPAPAMGKRAPLWSLLPSLWVLYPYALSLPQPRAHCPPQQTASQQTERTGGGGRE